MATHSSILARRIPRTEELAGYRVHGVAKSRTRLKRLSTHAHSHSDRGKRVCTRVCSFLGIKAQSARSLEPSGLSPGHLISNSSGHGQDPHFSA